MLQISKCESNIKQYCIKDCHLFGLFNELVCIHLLSQQNALGSNTIGDYIIGELYYTGENHLMNTISWGKSAMLSVKTSEAEKGKTGNGGPKLKYSKNR